MLRQKLYLSPEKLPEQRSACSVHFPYLGHSDTISVSMNDYYTDKLTLVPGFGEKRLCGSRALARTCIKTSWSLHYRREDKHLSMSEDDPLIAVQVLLVQVLSCVIGR